MSTRTKMHNKALQSEAPRLSGRAGADKGNPSPTATHLSPPTDYALSMCLDWRKRQVEEMARQAAFDQYQYERKLQLSHLQMMSELACVAVGGLVCAPVSREVMELEECRQGTFLPAGVTNGSHAVSAPTNSYGGDLGAV